MSHVVFLVTQQGCPIHIRGKGEMRSVSPSLIPIGKKGNKVEEDKSGTLTLTVGTLDVPTGAYRVTGSSAFHTGGDGFIICYDAEDPPVPVPNMVPGFASPKELHDALYHYVSQLSR